MIKLILSLCSFLILYGCTPVVSAANVDIRKTTESESPFASMTMMVSTDFHYALNEKEINDGIIPQIAYNNEITRALADQVIRVHPDVFVLCGDNTNDGKKEDLESLVGVLKEVKDAGIELIVIPGNHDLSSGGREQFNNAFKEILTKDSEDEDTLSYSRTVGDVMFLAMDDNGGSMTAEFPESTMTWLKQRLSAARQNNLTPVFVSHHSVLTVPSSSSASLYQIQNSDLKDVLKNGRVQLILSGHRHVPIITQEDGMTEIIHAMPDIYPNNVGMYELKGNICTYRNEMIDVEGAAVQHGWTDENLKNFREYSENATLSYISSVVRILNQSADLGEEDLNAADELFRKVYLAYMQGELYKYKDEILNSSYIDALYALTDSSNFGPWIHQILETSDSSNVAIEVSIQ